MKSSECLDLFNTIEADLPVEKWMVGRVQVWPLIRLRLWMGLNDDYRTPGPPLAANRPGRLTRRVAGAGYLARQLVGEARRASAARQADRAHSDRAGRADIVALGDGISRVRLDGNWYDRLCEPILEAGDELGHSSLHLEANHYYRVPRHRPSVFIQPAADRRRVLADLMPSALLPEAHLPGVERFHEVLRANDAEALAPIEGVRRDARQVDLLARMFARILKRTGARAGFVVDYGIVAMAFNQACKDMGVPSIEIQHGVQGELHWAYSRWSKVPLGGFGLVPQTFWTWSDEEAKVINRWASAGSGHRAVVGGNPWLQAWSGGGDLVRRYSDAARRLVGERRDGLRVLVALQPAMADQDLDRLRLAANLAPAEWRWVYRLHPTTSARESTRALNALGVSDKGDLIHEISELPLPALLLNVDVQVTINSTSIIEAAAFGVPSVALSSEAAAMYPREFRRGWVEIATGSAEIVTAIGLSAQRANTLTRDSAQLLVTSEVLADLLAI